MLNINHRRVLLLTHVSVSALHFCVILRMLFAIRVHRSNFYIPWSQWCMRPFSSFFFIYMYIHRWQKIWITNDTCSVKKHEFQKVLKKMSRTPRKFGSFVWILFIVINLELCEKLSQNASYLNIRRDYLQTSRNNI